MVESIKELLAFLRGVFLLMLATIFSLIAYIVNAEKNFNYFLAVYALIVLVVMDFLLAIIIMKNIKKLKELE